MSDNKNGGLGVEELDFEDLIERAAEIRVGKPGPTQKVVYLRWPRNTVRLQMVRDARARDLEEEAPEGTPKGLEITEFYHELCTRALAECVITKSNMDQDAWDRVLRAADGNAVEGLPEVVQKAMDLCGFGSAVTAVKDGEGEAETRDVTQEIEEGLGDDPLK